MKAENTVLNHSCKGKVIKESGEVLPHICVSIFSQALIIETIHLGNLLAFVVSTKDGNTIWVTNFEANKESHSLNGVVTTINVVSHEEVVGIRVLPSHFEKLLEIVELTMDVSTNLKEVREQK